jgi:hypothetical protein
LVNNHVRLAGRLRYMFIIHEQTDVTKPGQVHYSLAILLVIDRMRATAIDLNLATATHWIYAITTDWI